MRTFLIIASLMISTSVFSQTFQTISFKREYKKVKIKKPESSLNTILKEVDTLATVQVPLEEIKTVVEKQFEQVTSPLENLSITSNYGMRFHPILKEWKHHSGVDFKANSDTIRSVLRGVVEDSGYDKGLGYFIKIRHSNYVVTYAHLSQYFFLKGEAVENGVPLGVTGSTGMSTAEHLHLSVHKNGNSINPIGFLTKLMFLNNKIAGNERRESKQNDSDS